MAARLEAERYFEPKYRSAVLDAERELNRIFVGLRYLKQEGAQFSGLHRLALAIGHERLCEVGLTNAFAFRNQIIRASTVGRESAHTPGIGYQSSDDYSDPSHGGLPGRHPAWL